jgi:transcriptional regulator with XRE-family HTH domain
MTGPRDHDRIPGSRAFGALVKQRREELHMSRRELARQAGLKTDDVKVIEARMLKTFRASHVNAICLVLDIDKVPEDEPVVIELWWEGPRHLRPHLRRFFRQRRQELQLSMSDVAAKLRVSSSRYQIFEWEKRSFERECSGFAAQVATVLEVQPGSRLGYLLKQCGFKYVGPPDLQLRNRSEIDWDTVGLGTKPDGILAAELKISIREVFRMRKVRGIPAFQRTSKKTFTQRTPPYTAAQLREELGAPPVTNGKVDWTKVPLGCTSDGEVAAWLEMKTDTVKSARRSRSIPSWVPINWTKVPLGEVPDTVIAGWLGTSTTAVANRRRNAKIPPAPPERRRDVGGVYPTTAPPGLLTPRELRFPER